MASNDIESICKRLEEAIYDEEFDRKLKLIKDINSHREKVKVYDKERIISAILRTLSEEHRQSPDLTRAILSFLRGFIYEKGFKSEEEMFGLFSSLIKIQAFENKRFERLRETHQNLKKKLKIKSSLAAEVLKETRFMNTVLAKQNQIFYLSLVIAQEIIASMLEFAGENEQQVLSIQAQMHTYLKHIVYNLDRNDQALILMTLEMISGIVQHVGVPKDVKSTYLSLRLQRFFDSLVYLTPYLIFAQLFVRNAFSEAELRFVVPSILGSTTDRFMRDNKSNLISLLSADTSVKQTIVEKEWFLGIMGMYLSLVEKKVAKGQSKFEKFDLMRALINSLINLANLPEQADIMITNPLFMKLLQYAFETKDIGLLKLVNNVTHFCEPSHTKCMKERVLSIKEIIQALPGGFNKANRPVLFELIGILSNCCLGDEWEGFFTRSFAELINTILVSEDDPLRLQTILLVAQLVRNDKAAINLQKVGTFKLIFDNISEKDDREELFQKLFVAYQLLLTNFKIDPFMDSVLALVQNFLDKEFNNKNVRVVSFINELLFILQVKYKDNPDIDVLVIRR